MWEKNLKSFKESTFKTKLSFICMGVGQFLYGQKIKGCLFFLIELLYLFYFISRGWKDITDFFTLGTEETDTWLGIQGDNSIIILCIYMPLHLKCKRLFTDRKNGKER